MLRTRLTLLSLLAVLGALAVSAVGATAASATCYQVVVKETGRFATRATCEAGAPVVAKGEFINASTTGGTKLKPGEWCVKVETAGTGIYKDNACTSAEAPKEFIKAFVPEYNGCQEVAGAGTEPPIKYDNHECNTKTKPLAERKWEWKPITAAEKVEGTSGETSLEGEIAGLKVIIKCATDKFSGEIEALGASKGEITFETCGEPFQVVNHQAPEKITLCKVANIPFKFRDQLVPGNGIGPEDEFKPNAGVLFVEIEITGGSCTLPKKNKVEVTAENKGVFCALPEYAVGKTERVISCSSTGDENLRFAGNKASFTGVEKVHLANGWAWYIE